MAEVTGPGDGGESDVRSRRSLQERLARLHQIADKASLPGYMLLGGGGFAALFGPSLLHIAEGVGVGVAADAVRRGAGVIGRRRATAQMMKLNPHLAKTLARLTSGQNLTEIPGVKIVDPNNLEENTGENT